MSFIFIIKKKGTDFFFAERITKRIKGVSVNLNIRKYSIVQSLLKGNSWMKNVEPLPDHSKCIKDYTPFPSHSNLHNSLDQSQCIYQVDLSSITLI